MQQFDCVYVVQDAVSRVHALQDVSYLARADAKCPSYKALTRALHQRAGLHSGAAAADRGAAAGDAGGEGPAALRPVRLH